MQMTIGVDVGNFDTKTRNTSTVSGYSSYDNEQLLASKVLEYNGKYYVESIDNRLPYVEDKTDNDQCLVLALIAIAKEIIYRITNEQHIAGNIQDPIRGVSSINLGIGLPPGHFNKLAKKTITYYQSKMKNGIQFKYAGYIFSFKLNLIQAYAQDLSAVVMNRELKITNPESGAPKYYIVGIGGYTVDTIPISDGEPVSNECRSLSLGTRQMYETIITKVQADFGLTLDELAVDSVLRGKSYFIKEDVAEAIRKLAAAHSNLIVDKCIQAGLSFDLYPVIFVGGGALLLKPYLESINKICFSEFIDNVNANAASYEEYLRLKYSLKE